MRDIAKQIDDILPQTQCRECSYQDCVSYAKAVSTGERIDRCKPGGIGVLQKIAAITQRDATPFIQTISKNIEPSPRVVKIIEQDCIGCTKCIKACPVDAIVGAAKKMHTIITKECTGCNLCIPACPVDCIVPDNISPNYDREKARYRYQSKVKRLNKVDTNFQNISNQKTDAIKNKQNYIKKLLEKNAPSKD